MLQYQYSVLPNGFANSIRKIMCPEKHFETSLEYSTTDMNHLRTQLRRERKHISLQNRIQIHKCWPPKWPQNDPKMTPRWSQAGPRWSQGPQIPNCFEMGLGIIPKWSHFGVHFGTFFVMFFGDFLEPPFFVCFPKLVPKWVPKLGLFLRRPTRLKCSK